MPRKSDLLDELTGHIGYAATIELLRAWGGRRLRVPKELTYQHPISLAIGLSAAKCLAHFYGGDELELPAERTFLLEVRNNCILRDLRADSIRAVAVRYGVTPRHVRYIRDGEEKRRQANRQPLTGQQTHTGEI